jgi:hypothetical protein
VTDIKLHPNMNREDRLLSLSYMQKPQIHSLMDRKKFLSNEHAASSNMTTV